MLGAKKKAAKIAAATARRGEQIAERRYQEARSGRGPSQVKVMGQQMMGEQRSALMGVGQGQRNKFTKALAISRGQQAFARSQPRNLGQIASARAQEQLGQMGAAQGHQFGMIANQAQYQASAHNDEMIKAGIGAVGSAASSFI